MLTPLLFVPFTTIGNMSKDMGAMILHAGDREYILFAFWKTGSALGLSASLLIIFLMCILYEAVKALRIFLARAHASSRRQRRQAASPSVIVRDSAEQIDSASVESLTFAPLLRPGGAGRLFTCYRVSQALLYAAQVLLAYLLMLIVMTFNVWILIVVVVGIAVGYFLFTGEPVANDSLSDCC